MGGIEQRATDTPEIIGEDTGMMSIDERRRIQAQNEALKKQQKQEAESVREAERERKRLIKEKREAESRRINAERRAKEKMERRRTEIQQEDIRKTEATSKELGIESIKPKELKLKKLKQEKDIRLIPSGQQAKVILKEAELGIKEGISDVTRKVKKGLTLLPEKTRKLAIKGVKAGVGVVAGKFKEQEAYQKALVTARQRAKLYAQKKRIYREEMISAGMIQPRVPKGTNTQRNIGSERRLGISMPLFQPRQDVGFEKSTTISRPLFTPRQNVGFEKKAVNTLPLFQPKPARIMDLERAKNTNKLTIGRVSPNKNSMLTIGKPSIKAKQGQIGKMELFDFNKNKRRIL
jgi:hypothetical protein